MAFLELFFFKPHLLCILLLSLILHGLLLISNHFVVTSHTHTLPMGMPLGSPSFLQPLQHQPRKKGRASSLLHTEEKAQTHTLAKWSPLLAELRAGGKGGTVVSPKFTKGNLQFSSWFCLMRPKWSCCCLCG